MNEITREIRERYWINIIRECSSSGIPKAQWLKEHGISNKTYYKHQKAIQEKYGPAFLDRTSGKANLPASACDESVAVEIPLKSDSSISPASHETTEPSILIQTETATIRIPVCVKPVLAKAIIQVAMHVK